VTGRDKAKVGEQGRCGQMGELGLSLTIRGTGPALECCATQRARQPSREPEPDANKTRQSGTGATDQVLDEPQEPRWKRCDGLHKAECRRWLSSLSC
jgi:hypothetical protein